MDRSFLEVIWQIIKVVVAGSLAASVFYFAWVGFCNWLHIKDEPVDEKQEYHSWQREQHRWWG